MSLKNIQACVFDAYGTLFDVHSAVGRYRSQIGDQADNLSQIWRQKQLEYTWLRSLMQEHADFWSITGHALEYACHAVGLPELPVRRELLEAYLELECYPEVPHVLATLKTRGLRTAILSNGTSGMIEAAVNNAGISELVDAVYSVEEVGIFKPSPRVYQLAVDTLKLKASEISFMSSNAWDVAGAANFGLRVVWINRFKQPSERLPGKPAAELADLSGLPGLLV